MAVVVLASLISFIATEIDDFLMLLVLFTKADAPAARCAVVVGKYLGLAALIASCTVFSRYLGRLSGEVLGLAGLVPIAVGITYPSRLKKKKDRVPVLSSIGSFFAVCAGTLIMTLGNGADNIGIYVPFFASLRGSEFVVMNVVFALMQALSCFFAMRLVGGETVQLYLRSFARSLIPAAFIFLGVYILLKNGTVMWLIGLLRSAPGASHG